jgi:cell wall assembly regulator SMI1
MAITVTWRAPVGERMLERVEASLGVSIPEDYRKFLEATDGGRPVEDTFSPMVGVNRFLGASEMIESRERLHGRLPATLLPIADAEGGNRICISVAEHELGAIYFWDHELEHLGADKAADRIAASFDDFISQLRVMSRDELPPHRVISVEIDPEFLKLAREQEERERQRPTLRWPPERNE